MPDLETLEYSTFGLKSSIRNLSLARTLVGKVIVFKGTEGYC